MKSKRKPRAASSTPSAVATKTNNARTPAHSWQHIPRAVAWVPRPMNISYSADNCSVSSSSVFSRNEDDSRTHSSASVCHDTTTNKSGSSKWTNKSTSGYLWWPSVLYPSWKSAALDEESGFMPCQKKTNKSTEATVRISGCKNRVKVSHLSQNLVPAKAVLGRQNAHNRRPRVVCHYLGLSGLHTESVAEWGAVSVGIVQPYLNSKREALQIIEGEQKATMTADDWGDLLYAMEEVSIFLMDESLRPERLLFSTDFPEREDDAGTGHTPEFYDEWTSQTQDGPGTALTRSQSQFSQAKRVWIEAGESVAPSQRIKQTITEKNPTKKRRLLDTARTMQTHGGHHGCHESSDVVESLVRKKLLENKAQVNFTELGKDMEGCKVTEGLSQVDGSNFSKAEFPDVACETEDKPVEQVDLETHPMQKRKARESSSPPKKKALAPVLACTEGHGRGKHEVFETKARPSPSILAATRRKSISSEFCPHPQKCDKIDHEKISDTLGATEAQSHVLLPTAPKTQEDKNRKRSNAVQMAEKREHTCLSGDELLRNRKCKEAIATNDAEKVIKHIEVVAPDVFSEDGNCLEVEEVPNFGVQLGDYQCDQSVLMTQAM